MSDFLFVAQEMLDSWMMSGKIDFSGHVMTIRGDRRSYVLEPAVRFVRIVGEEEDQGGLIGKVKTVAQVEAAGGEHYADSVIVQDTAYEVQNGFVARVTLPETATPPPSAVAPGVAEGPGAPPVTPEVPPPAPAPAPVAPAPAPPPAPAAPAAAPAAPPVEAAAPAPASPPPAPAAPPAPEAATPEAATGASSDDEGEAQDDADLLTDFLLKNLR